MNKKFAPPVHASAKLLNLDLSTHLGSQNNDLKIFLQVALSGEHSFIY